MDYFNEAGKRCLFINVPLTFPPQPVNGINIAGFPVPPDSEYIYPSNKVNHIKEMGYVTDWMEIYKNNKSVPKATLIKEADKSQLRVFASLMREDNWDVAMIVISGTDHIAHLEWQQGNVNEVKKYYSFIDGLLNDMYKEGIFNDASIIVMSDHGFSGGSHTFFLNTWLSHEGYLVYQDKKDETYDIFLKGFRKSVYGEHRGLLSKMLKGIGLTRENLIYLGKKTGLIRLERYLPHSLISLFPSHEYSIDWSKTKAYMLSNASKGININLIGRERTGIVSFGEYDDLRHEIIIKLKNLKGNKGDAIINIADTKENIYNGPFASEGPDIITWPNPKYKIRIGSKQKKYLRRVTEAQHSLEGIFIFSGSDFIVGSKQEVSIMDIAPTLLHILGLAVPDDMDGRVMEEILIDKPDSDNMVRFRKPLSKDFGPPQMGKIEFDNEDVIEKLKTLGYM